jgi:SAM-dependent methyltransferase
MLVYGPLAAHLVERSPFPTLGRDVLDAGAGTGAVGALLIANGANVISCDLEHDMLSVDARDRAVDHATVADITALPFADCTFDIGVAAFVLNHLADPIVGLCELGRVTRSGGAVLASVFGGARAPAKDAIDEVLAAHGWRPPNWYQTMHQRAAALATPAQMTLAARRAGLVEIVVCCAEIDVGLDDASMVVRYRLGMAQVSGWFEGLAATEQSLLRREAVSAVEQTGQPFRPEVVELVARVG